MSCLEIAGLGACEQSFKRYKIPEAEVNLHQVCLWLGWRNGGGSWSRLLGSGRKVGKEWLLLRVSEVR